MVDPLGLKSDFDETVREFGMPIRFKYFSATQASGNTYDDDKILVQSGADVNVSGVMQPLKGAEGQVSHDDLLRIQGKILQDDSKLYVGGTTQVQTSGIWRVQVGNREYSAIENGVVSWQVQGEEIYKKLFIRILSTGSLIGESGA